MGGGERHPSPGLIGLQQQRTHENEAAFDVDEENEAAIQPVRELGLPFRIRKVLPVKSKI